MELIRDPIRMSFAIFGALILELTVAYGISFDMTPVGFAVIDHDNSKESRATTISTGTMCRTARLPWK